MQANQDTVDEKLHQIIDRFWETVPPVWHQVRSHIRGVAVERLGITVEQFHILRHIRTGSGSISELAAEKHISRSAISQAVELLVSKGLVTRRENAADRRFVQLDLTPSGNDLLSAIHQENRAWMISRLAVLTPQEQASLEHSMGLLKKAFIDPQPEKSDSFASI
jgi:DNA-binding MarR family transcriptional regulator